MSFKRCQMCQNHKEEKDLVKVRFYGWNQELKIPAQIHLCQRCSETWKNRD